MSRAVERRERDRIVVYGTTWCPDCQRSKKVLEERGVGYEWVDIERVSGAEEQMLAASGGKKRVPTIVFAGGAVLIEPPNQELEAKLAEMTA